jgi:hypothetical protein
VRLSVRASTLARRLRHTTGHDRPSCTGWYFEHTPGCFTPNLACACSDRYAEPGTGHLYPCSLHYIEPPPDLLDAASWPGAAHWPGHAVDDDED